MAENLPQENSGQSGEGLKVAIAAFFFLGLFILALGIGLFFFSKQSNSSDEIQIISAEEDLPAGRQVLVHVDGAVINPGVYKLGLDARVNDAIVAAGGLSTQADAAKINLAAKISDGQKIHVFAIGEQGTSDKGQVTSESSSLVNINTAPESELDKLPGVGPVTAQKIIASRPYSTSEDLLTKKAVSASVYDKIKGLITY